MSQIKLNTLLFLLFVTSLLGQVKNIGLPEIRNFKRTDYKGGTQNWNIDQDKNGNLYFANNNGLFQFDGSTWRKFPLPNSPDTRCLKIAPSGKIFIGRSSAFASPPPTPNEPPPAHTRTRTRMRTSADAGC